MAWGACGTLDLILLMCVSCILGLYGKCFFNCCFIIITLLPNIGPVTVYFGSCTSTNDLKYVFCRIVLRFAFGNAAFFEVSNDVFGVWSNIAEVNRSSAFLQQ